MGFHVDQLIIRISGEPRIWSGFVSCSVRFFSGGGMKERVVGFFSVSIVLIAWVEVLFGSTTF
jgi:hypothetical protein